MPRITAPMLWAAASTFAASTAAAQGIYSPSVVHGTSRHSTIAQPAAPLRPAAPAPGVTSIAPSVVLGWGGLPPSVGAPTGSWAPAHSVAPGYFPPGYPVHVVPVPIYPSPYGSALPGPDPSSRPLHRWSTP